MKTFAFIFARSGSKGLKKKNIKLLNDKPLVAYSIESAIQNNLISDIFISTDDNQIHDIAKQYKIHCIIRPPELTNDTASEYLSWQHAINYVKDLGLTFDRFISLPPTAPLRNNEDITNALLKLDNETDFVVTITDANRSPYFNMVHLKNDFIEIVNKSKTTIIRRQDAPTVFDLTTVAYVSRPQTILTFNSLFEGKIKAITIPKKRAIDIDDEIDFYFAEYLLKRENNVK